MALAAAKVDMPKPELRAGAPENPGIGQPSPDSRMHLGRTFKNAINWLWAKIWAWEPLTFLVGAVCIPVAFVVALEQMYGLARGLLVFGGICFSAKIFHDAIAEKKPAREIVAASFISGIIIGIVAVGGWWIVNRIEWNHEVVITMTFKSSALFTEKRKKAIIWNLNEYYRYLKKAGFELPTDIPPLGLSPPGGPMLSGGGLGPAYYSHLIITEDRVDDQNTLHYIYSSYTFNRSLVGPDAFKSGVSRVEVEDDEESAWIFSCYFPASYSGDRVCAEDAPGHKWNDAMWEVRNIFGQEYADELMCFTVKMWGNIPAKYTESFDRFFRYRLAAGESVKDNGQRGAEINEVFKRHDLDITIP